MNVKHKLEGIVLLNADGIPDSAGDVFDIEGIKIPRHDIPVSMDIGHRIPEVVGFAACRKEKGQVIADIVLFRNLHQIPLYPCVEGAILERDGKNIKGALIKSVSFSVIGNCDKRIKPITLEKK